MSDDALRRQTAPMCVQCGRAPQATAGLCRDCIGRIYEEADREHQAWVARGVCDRCGATSAREAEGKCEPGQGPDGCWRCPGEELWPDDDTDEEGA